MTARLQLHQFTRCVALHCNQLCESPRVMCPRHWDRVDPAIRSEVAEFYETSIQDRSPLWSLALRRAINSVGLAEGYMTPRQAEQTEADVRKIVMSQLQNWKDRSNEVG